MQQPFGDPDGSRGPIEEREHDFIMLPRDFGAIARPAHEATRTRVIAGAQGAGKTLYLRRLQNHLSHDDSVYADRPSLTAKELPTDLVIKVSQLYPRSANSEMWKRLWDRAILISGVTHLLRDSAFHGSAHNRLVSSTRETLHQLYPEVRGTRAILDVAAQICSRPHSRRELDAYLGQDAWTDLRQSFHELMRLGRPLYLFVDAIDDNFRWAPAYWLTCQRGLFYAVMDTQRTEVESGRLHVVISVRDLVLSSVATSEHASRYISSDYILSLDWTWESIREFFREKLRRVDNRLFPNGAERTAAGFLGRETIRNEARDMDEPCEQYLLRHTRLNPRDVIIMGNALASIAVGERTLANVSDRRLRDKIAKTSRQLGRNAIAQVANQVLTNVMPWNAAQHAFIEPYLTTDEYRVDALGREVLSIIAQLETERFSVQQLRKLNNEAELRFGDGAQLGHVLWQNRLLGYQHGGTFHFYSGGSDTETTIPLEAPAYVLNPIVLDLVPSIESSKGQVVFPGVDEA